MRYLTSALIILLCNHSYPQQQVADLIIPINVTLEDTINQQLVEIGLDSTATDSIDAHLGEFILPPIPPPGYVAFLILPYNNFNEELVVHKDFRFGELPYTGSKEHRLRIMSTGGATISWILPSGTNGYLQDIFGGVILNVPLSGSGSYYISNLNSVAGRFKLLINYYDVIPVELISFTASILQNEKTVQLNWTTTTETNNSGFEIQKQKLGGGSQELEWNAIGFVPGFGTTTEPKSYSFIDEDVTTGIYKYRLKQIDFDGSFEYSNEIEVEIDFTPKEFVLYQNFPNPFNPSTVISYQLPVTDNVTLKIYDVLGNEVKTLVNEEKQPGVYEVEFDASTLASGMYLYKLKAGTFVQTKKMILSK